jgi:glycosyltransferase involved in cell wall biosynthesis
MQTNKIRILHLVDGLVMGGAEVLITQIIEALGTEKYKHFVFYFADDGPIREKIETLGILVYKGNDRASIKQPIRFMVTLFDLVRDLISFIRSKRIQIIQSHMGPANQLAVTVGKLLKIPTFPTVHTPLAFVDERSRWDTRVCFKKALNQFVYRMADRVVVVSQEIKEIFQKRFSLENDNFFVLKNGIVLEDNFPKSDVFEKEFPDSENKLKIIAVGRLVPLKNFNLIVRAAKELINRNLTNFLVLISGEGGERPMLEALIKELEVDTHVKLLGLRDDIIDLMMASDLFVMSSSYEGLSIAMIEAMACGLPIISSDIRGIRDCITHEQNGLLYPVGDHKALADCILQLAEDEKLREKLSHGSRKSFETEYDMHKNIKSLDSLFQQYCIHN